MARRRQRRRREKQQRHAPRSVGPAAAADDHLGGPIQPLVYSRVQAAQVLGISLATLDRRVIPAIATVKTEWGARLIPAAEFERYLAERTEPPRAPRRRATLAGRKSMLPPEVIERIRIEYAQGASLAAIARGLNHDDIPTG